MVIRTKELLNCTLEYYKDEDHWLTPSKSIKKIAFTELLKDIITVQHMRSSYKCHIMSIVFENYSVLIGFKSRTTMESWITKLNNIRGRYCSYMMFAVITTESNTAHFLENNSYQTCDM